MAKRNRVIYQSEALFVSAQYSGHNTIDIIDGSHVPLGTPLLATGVFHQIHRVQSANYNFAISRTDVNQFGNLARIDSAIIEAPTVGLDFSFLVTDGSNEDKLGITVDSVRDQSAVSGILSNVSGRNYHIVTIAEGGDANSDGAISATNVSQATTSTIISIGNGFVTNYSMNAAIGSIPSASVSVEGLNITAQPSSTAELSTPAMNSSNSTAGTATFQLPTPVSGTVGDILRPGDMEINLNNATGLLANFADSATANSAHIQSFSIDVPLGRSVINRLGNAFGFSKEVDFPVTVSCSISAIVADLKAGNLFNELYSTEKHEMQIIMRKPAAGGGAAGAEQIRYKLKGVVLNSESFSSSIGDNKTVDLSFSATVGGPEDTTNGLFISGTSVSTAVKSAS
tara:strand:- start:343 stop:1536 length:1194 start_codon:yes stop_codon:yes gene_type:complete